MRRIGKLCRPLLLGAFLAIVLLLGSGEDVQAANNWNKVNGKCYNGVGKLIPGAITRGMDVSQWQGKINWTQVKQSGIDFAFIRVGYAYRNSNGKIAYQQDTYYQHNIQGANSAGIPAGVYIYSKAKTTDEAVADAQYLISKVKGYKISYPLVLDMEDDSLSEISRAEMTQNMKAFCDEVKKAGYYPMIYSNQYWYNYRFYPDNLKAYDLWIAGYSDAWTGIPGNCRHTIWQATDGDNSYRNCYSTKGLIAGIPTSNSVDMDFGYVDYTKIITPRYAPVSSYQPGNVTQNGWKTVGGKRYYMVNGEAAVGWKKIDGKYYRFDYKTGYLLTNRLIKYASGNVCYVNENGVRTENGWVKYGGEYYYMKNGYAIQGLQKINGKCYYFYGSTKYCARNKLLYIKGEPYFFQLNGVRYNNGWKTVKYNGKYYTYYFNKSNSTNIYEDGKALKGWYTIGGKRYYFRKGTKLPAGTRAENMTLRGSQATYVFDKNGVLVSTKYH